MAVNRFDKPIESEYISQYTPIPFEQLYAIGKANNERVDKAYNDLANQFSKWGEFRSPSAVDTKRFYDYTIGAAQGIVNQLAANPDLIKTAEGRSMIQSFINSRPYNELSQLQQSREGLLQRQAVNQKLMLAGKYNPLWHDVDFTNYDTVNSGIYNDIAPLAYKSERELVEPFVNNLKPGFIKQEGMYDWRGVSTDRTDTELAKNLSSIYNTPEAQKHLEILQRQGLSKQEAEEQFARSLFTAGREFAYQDRELNPLAKLDYAASLKNEYQQPTSRPMRLTESIATTGSQTFNVGTRDYVREKYSEQVNQIYDKYQKALESGDKLAANTYEAQLTKIREEARSYTPQKLFKDIFSQYMVDNKLTNISLANATNEILNRLSTPLKNSKVNDLLQETIPGVSSDKVNTDFGKRRVITNGMGLDLATDVFTEIAGLKHVSDSKDKFRQALKSGRVNDMIVLQGSNFITLPSKNGDTVSPNSSQIVTVAIPQSSLDKLGITDRDMIISGAKRIYNNKGKSTYSIDVKKGEKKIQLTGRYFNEDDGYHDEYEHEGKYSSSMSNETMYWQIDLLNKIPDPNGQLNAEYLDQQAWRLSMSDAARGELFSSTQRDAYGVGYSAGEDDEDEDDK